MGVGASTPLMEYRSAVAIINLFLVVIFFLPSDNYPRLGKGRDEVGRPSRAAVMRNDWHPILVLSRMRPGIAIVIRNALPAPRIGVINFNDAHLRVVMSILVAHGRVEEITIWGLLV